MTVSETSLVHDRVRAVARRTPTAVALRKVDRELTYGELIDRADELAATLRASGVEPGDRVAISAERSFELITGMLAILIAGAAYVPIDPSYPAQRREFMLADAAPRALLIGNGAPVMRRAGANASAGLAYVIYTSGSTGEPKGVEIPHDALTNLVDWHVSAFGLTTADVTPLLASIGFDASVWELWPSLVAGATVALVPDETRSSPERLRDWLLAERVTVAFLPTVLAERVLELDWPEQAPLRTLLTGGDRLRRRPRAGLPFALVNNYGPTECTVVATSGRVAPGDGAPSIGRPIEGVSASVLNPAGDPVEPGAVGELYLSGAGLALGYLGRPELSAERFVTLPDGMRAYRTGDLVSVRGDGDLDFHGRCDDQVKIRGHRIEPDEVAAVLASHAAVGAAAAVARDARLIAYCTPHDLDVDALHEHLAAALPAWMLPAAIVPLAALPVTAHGKVDRAALPDLARAREKVASRTAGEAALLEIWRDVLGYADFGVTDPFDEVGGHSLAAAQVAARVAGRFGVDLGVAAFARRTTIAELSEALAAAHPSAAPAPARRTGAGLAPLTAAQRRLWFLDRFVPDLALYTNGLRFDLTGEVDLPALQRALNGLVARHHVLRTRYVETAGGPRQEVVDDVEVPLETLDDAAAASALPFDLSAPPHLRAFLAERQLLLTVHHIAFDGWSIDVLVRDLAALYAGERLPELPLQIADVAEWEAATPAIERLEAYWRARLEGHAGVALPADRPEPAVRAYQGAAITRPVPDELRGADFETLLAGLLVVLRRQTGQDDLVVGVPAAARLRPEFERLIGCFVNTLPLRCDVSGHPTFAALRDRVRDVAAGALAHQALPFDRMVEFAGRDLVRVMLVVQPPPAAPVRAGGLEVSFREEVHAGAARFDLTVVFEHRAGVPSLSLEYDARRFDAATVERLLDQLLGALAAAPDTPIDDIRLHDEQATVALGRGERLHRPAVPAHALVEARTAAQPGALAVVCGADRCTYAELGARANALAWRLRGEGVTPEQPVAVCVERSLASVVALLAVMKAGGVYVPLDPSYPDERLGQMLADVRPRVLVASPSHAHRLRAVVEITPDGRIGDAPRTDDPPAVTGPEHLAYAIHTSGSTGRPKGVLLEHGGLVNLVLGKIDRFAVRADSRVLQFVSFGFGVSVADVLMTLAAGATLVVRGPEALAGPALARLLEEQAITNLVVPASVLASLPGAELPALRAIAVGGEPCPADLVARWAPGRHFVQAYGPTEATVCATTAQCVPDERRPSVGRPLPNVDVVIADARLRPVPPGVPGELLIGGAGLARGYLDRPDLTAERFVPNPFGTAGERLYRTGDLARMRPDGSVELLGRADDQVQLRGIRIELGDIEAALRAHPAVAEAAAAVHAHPVAGDQLVGYVIAASPLPELRGFLRERLPDGLVPAVVVALDALPRTASGKLDRRALPAPPAPAAGSRAPETATELLLAELWTELLRPAAAICADDDFFALGGQSLLAAQLAARVRDCFEIELPIRAVFDDPTIAALAERVETAIMADLKEPQWS